MGYDREEKLMKMMPSSPYRDLLTRKRWKLKIGYWMLIGVYVEHITEQKQRIETLKDGKLKDTIDKELKRLDDWAKANEDWDDLTWLQKTKRTLSKMKPKDFLPWNMPKRSPLNDETFDWIYEYVDVLSTRHIRVRDWMELDNCFTEDGEIIENELWEMMQPHVRIDFSGRFRATADMKHCDVPSRDHETGATYPFAPESEWAVEAFIEFGQREGLDIKWLIEDIRKFNNELADTSVNWSVKPPQRESKYGWILTTTLQMMNAEGEPRPNDQAVLKRWMENTPQGIQNVTLEGFEFKNASGDWEPIGAVALRSAINRKIE
jgi:hypothetical protein